MSQSCSNFRLEAASSRDCHFFCVVKPVCFSIIGVFLLNFFQFLDLWLPQVKFLIFLWASEVFFWDACVLCFVNFFLNLRPPQVKFAFFLCVVKIVCFYVIVVFFHLFFCIFPTRPQVDQTPVCDSIVASRKNADSLS